MLSDSEDFDEDELLQMALKEQAQHNPPSSRASVLVKNPIPVQQLKKGIAHQQQKKGTVEEDDDLEVERRIISSGDEDDGGIGVKTQAERRKDDDKGWDGE
ncbi:exocyst complex component SEC5A [Olea europaea subsp. europaea]|uniref:Exocyst complex component SEC5A n=1 Tax=Olea europaea subsp. europaea TaxID=158383 RepID=A0A8S0SYX5_OLEEU|nr:exocyst complex component SEC5A [Olea europaea subsp. europaea]